MHILYDLTLIPDVVWSALLASALTLAGVMLSNRSNTKRLMRQLSHDSNEKEKERINSLRRDVYLKAIEELARVNSYLGKLPQLNPLETNLGDGLSDFFAIAAKLQLVCKPETSGLTSDLVAIYAELLMGLLAKVSPIHNLNINIRLAGSFYDRNEAEVTRALAAMTQLNESGQPDPTRFAALQSSFEGAQKPANHFAQERADAYAQQQIAMRNYTVELLKEIQSIGNMQVRFMAAIRSELGLTTDTSELEARLLAFAKLTILLKLAYRLRSKPHSE